MVCNKIIETLIIQTGRKLIHAGDREGVDIELDIELKEATVL